MLRAYSRVVMDDKQLLDAIIALVGAKRQQAQDDARAADSLARAQYYAGRSDALLELALQINHWREGA